MSRFSMCPYCGHRLRRVRDNWGNWDGETYTCDYCDMGEEEDDDDGLSVYEAADIWASSGMDEDYTFGYSEEELNDAFDN